MAVSQNVEDPEKVGSGEKFSVPGAPERGQRLSAVPADTPRAPAAAKSIH